MVSRAQAEGRLQDSAFKSSRTPSEFQETKSEMTSTRFEVDKFNGTNDFSLWRIKMKAFLVHQGISEALDVEAMDQMDDKKKKNEIEAKAHSAILLSLGDEVLREVADC